MHSATSLTADRQTAETDTLASDGRIGMALVIGIPLSLLLWAGLIAIVASRLA